nr:hypothetical protein [Planococcus glaciei]
MQGIKISQNPAARTIRLCHSNCRKRRRIHRR